MEGHILAQRQVLSGIVSSATSAIGNIGDAASSAASSVSSAISTSKDSSVSTSVSRTSSASSASETSSSSSLTSSSSTGSSSSSSTTTSVSTSETLSTALSSSSSESATSSLPSVSESVYETTSDGVTRTMTSFMSAAEESATGSSSSAASTQTAATHKSFLQNKSLSGFVFALCGIVGLVLILLVVTFTLRRRRKNKLLNEAISFDPQGSVYPDRDMEEKLTHQRAVDSIGGSVSGTRENSSSTGHGMYMPPAPHGYYDAGYGQAANAYTYTNYAPPRPEVPNPNYDHLGVTHNMGSLAFENRSMSPPRSQVPAMGPLPNNFGQNYASYGMAQPYEGR
ncbi:uncharacterized protein EV420DRAFT_466098 [Desarmillaria tabescens]|uniref:REJ domain-containing protein n=1 Tax=Armillaria tabescens TaxID=1929756 RepID=A0AA39NML8_ARMTA|nr:uncharacterized protein EV420DRAFT_466098 [Desarmillaria tabescens]KAK0468437.1 hypothetical protein EV420DRAFT_466098 [Desarmillaria tabescens]